MENDAQSPENAEAMLKRVFEVAQLLAKVNLLNASECSPQRDEKQQPEDSRYDEEKQEETQP